MESGTGIYIACCAAYLFNEGRLLVVLMSLCIFWWIRNKEHRKALRCTVDTLQSTPTVTPKKSQSIEDGVVEIKSKIYEIDFTANETLMTEPKAFKRVRPKRKPKIIKATKTIVANVHTTLLLNAQIYIFYLSLTGSALRAAKTVRDLISPVTSLERPPIMLSLDDDVDNLDKYFLKAPGNAIYVLILPSYDTDSPIDYFLEHLTDTANDFRVDAKPLSVLKGFAVLGVGDSESWPGQKFCYQARLVDRGMLKLGAHRLFPLGQVCIKLPGASNATALWALSFAQLLSEDAPLLSSVANDLDSDDAAGDVEADDALVDLEDFASAPKEMVPENSPTYKALTKQGYVIVGSHSGVKICRWTRSALRGRGSCYKFAFYGIRSHLCMETTPSLACANKCVFCWRHGTNPVAKLKWRWNVDPAQTVLDGALKGHYQKIKQLRGVPGINHERFQEALRVRHCALSLVGEPIIYPHINEFVDLLHAQHISSFLVCNAQHPDNLTALNRVTQLYVSIDAASRESLRKIDRPLNLDFWERMEACLDILRTTQSHQRTVFRLTLVKGFNMDDVSGYADMVARAMPSQIEIKGATFCGSSSNGDALTMQNMPFYEECCAFVESVVTVLHQRGLNYNIAAAHAHSCCILIAHNRFNIDGKWHTHIDYPRFFELLESGAYFKDIDYVVPTPAWAVWGAPEEGFDPVDTRFNRKAEKEKRRLDRTVEAKDGSTKEVL